MAQKTEGIQQLLIAEKKASEKVTEARKLIDPGRSRVNILVEDKVVLRPLGKALKLKTAKKEAEVEIARFKADKETQYKKLEEEMLGKKSDNEAQIQVVTNQKMKDIEAMFRKNKPAALKTINEVLFDISIRLHENVKL